MSESPRFHPKPSRQERLVKRFVPLVTLMALGSAVLYPAVKEVHDELTVDKLTYTLNVTTYPNISEGSKIAIREMMNSANSAEAAAANNIDSGEVVDTVATTIVKETGEQPREQTGHIVNVVVESDGDVVDTILRR